MNPRIAGSSMRVKTEGMEDPQSLLPNEIIPTCKHPLRTAPPETKREWGRGRTVKVKKVKVNQEGNFSFSALYVAVKRFLFNSWLNFGNLTTRNSSPFAAAIVFFCIKRRSKKNFITCTRVIASLPESPANTERRTVKLVVQK
jgi:hypothetical protein